MNILHTSRSRLVAERAGSAAFIGCLNKQAIFPSLKPTARSQLQRISQMASAAASSTQTGHQVPDNNVVSEEATDPEIKAFQEHQATVAKLSHAEEARTLVEAGRWGVISTLGSGDTAGYPCGSVVEYAPDETGRLLFAFSSMSSHTSDVRKDGRASLTIPSPDFKGLSDARISLTGDIAAVKGDEEQSVRATYKRRHPNSFWVDFGDFTLFRLTPKTGRLIGGFARAGQIPAEEYFAAKPDPVYQFSGPVAGHMNADHADSTRAIVKQVVGITVSKAEILTLDRLGMYVRCERDGQTFKARVPFSRPAEDRKAIKDVIVEMTRAAAGS